MEAGHTGRGTEARPPAAFLAELLPRLREALAADPAPVLDLACGRGRNARAAAAAGLSVVGLDRDTEALGALREAGVPVARADLEAGHAIPLADACLGAVLVFRYLHRPLAPEIERVLRPGGWLVYETFTTAQREQGWGPRREAFLLRPGELPSLFPGLSVERFEECLSGDEPPAAVARLLARKPSPRGG